MFDILSLSPGWLTHRVNLDKVRLFVTLSYFRPDKFVQHLSLKPILILLSYLLVSKDQGYTMVFSKLDIKNSSEEEQLFSKFNLICSGRYYK